MNRSGLVKLGTSLKLPLKKESSTINGKHFLWPLNELCITVIYTEFLIIVNFSTNRQYLKWSTWTLWPQHMKYAKFHFQLWGYLVFQGLIFCPGCWAQSIQTGTFPWDAIVGLSQGPHSFSPIPSREFAGAPNALGLQFIDVQLLHHCMSHTVIWDEY